MPVNIINGQDKTINSIDSIPCKYWPINQFGASAVNQALTENHMTLLHTVAKHLLINSAARIQHHHRFVILVRDMIIQKQNVHA